MVEILPVIYWGKRLWAPPAPSLDVLAWLGARAWYGDIVLYGGNHGTG